MAAEARHVTLYGLLVRDPEGYARYRGAMEPILHAYGGRFGYDLEVSAVLRSEVETPMNRVFTIAFPDEAAKVRFFEDPDYRVVRRTHFEGAVESVAELASFSEV